MKVEILPLSGKYYGTEVLFVDGPRQYQVTFWDNADYEPSVRELEQCGLTQEEWDNNTPVPDPWGGSDIPCREADIIDSSHFESKGTYEFVKKLKRKLEE